jgi:hypothetical protein
MKSLNTKLLLTALGIALLASPAAAQRPSHQSTVVVNGQVIGADPDPRIQFELLRDWDSLRSE